MVAKPWKNHGGDMRYCILDMITWFSVDFICGFHVVSPLSHGGSKNIRGDNVFLIEAIADEDSGVQWEATSRNA